MIALTTFNLLLEKSTFEIFGLCSFKMGEKAVEVLVHHIQTLEAKKVLL